MAIQPMTENDYINQVHKDNPAIFSAEKIQLTPVALREALRAAWRAGRESHRDDRIVGFLDNLLRPHHR